MADYAYRGDAQFLAWGDGPQGPWIKLKLPDSDDLEPFRGMTQSRAGIAGQILAVGIIEVKDGEQPSAEADAKIIEAAKGGELARLSGILCNTPDFQTWLRETFPDDWMAEAAEKPGTCIDTDITARILRRVCFVQSRAELDHNARAAELFHSRIRRPWQEHCAK